MISAIQFVEETKDRETAESIFDSLSTQVDYLGGRVLAPSPSKPHWRVQVFFQDVDDAASPWLPDGCRRVIIPESQARAVGIL